jgi:hypothetical protein
MQHNTGKNLALSVFLSHLFNIKYEKGSSKYHLHTQSSLIYKLIITCKKGNSACQKLGKEVGSGLSGYLL